MTETVLKIGGMTCMHCVGRVEKALNSVDGVSKATVNLEEKEALVEYEASKVGTEKLKEAVEEAGYKAV